MKDKFVHLHLHTEYSLLDGVGKIEEYVNRAKELGMSALAITDHGNMFGAIEFYQKALKGGIKPIIGMEAYLAEFSIEEKKGKNFHLVLLAKNEVGYQNLVKLSSISYKEGFYYKARIDKKLLKKYSEGIIALSACMAGEISYYLLNNKYEKAREALLSYKEIFYEDFYIELQDNGIKGQDELNEELYKLALDNEVEVVGTNDVHYAKHGEHYLQDIVICIQTGAKLKDEKRMKINSDQMYMKSYEQLYESLGRYKGAIENTKKIAEKCNLEFNFNKFKFPHYKIPDTYDNIDVFLRSLAMKGLKKRFPNENSSNVIKRLEYELETIKKMGYSVYFVVVWDLINYAKNNNIPIGPGRGSAAGSIVAYLLGITEINPIKYKLIFERFLNPERISMPDIDIDICQERREELIDYVAKKYGYDKVAHIITFGTMKARAAIRDVGRVLDISLDKVDKVAKLIPQFSTIDQALKDSIELSNLYNKQREIQVLINYAMGIEGRVRHASVHAAGIVITKESLENIVPTYYDKNSNLLSTQYQMKELESLGLLKMDFLGLKNLTILKRTLDYIREYKGISLDLEEIPLDDSKSYKLLQKGETLGIFQLESQGMIKLMKKLLPDKFEDIIALLALYRPGPLGSGMVDAFIDTKLGLSRAKYPHPSLREVLEETHGMILYQEQVMKIANIMANYSMSEADLLRRAMSKKSFGIMEEKRNDFIKRSMENSYSKELAEEVFYLIDKFAGYGFNKSHSAAYALIAYWTAYLKSNFTIYYFAALMTSEIKNIEKLSLFIEDSRRYHINLKLPDVNSPANKFIIKNSQIIFGMSAIKNIGENLVKDIISERHKGEFKDLEDFVFRMKKYGLNKKSLEALILSGSTDSLGGNRKQKYLSITKVLDIVSKRYKEDEIQQMNLFGQARSSFEKLELANVEEMDLRELLQYEKEYIGFYISGHPLDRYSEIIKALDIDKINSLDINSKKFVSVLGIIKNIKKLVTKNSRENMAILEVEDYNSIIKGTLFPKQFSQYVHFLFDNTVVYIEGNLVLDTFNGNEELKLNISKMIDIEEVNEIKNLKVYILVEDEDKLKLSKLKKIIKKYKGDHEVFIAFRQNKNKNILKLPKNLAVSINKTFIQDIQNLLGDYNIKIKK